MPIPGQNRVAVRHSIPGAAHVCVAILCAWILTGCVTRSDLDAAQEEILGLEQSLQASQAELAQRQADLEASEEEVAVLEENIAELNRELLAAESDAEEADAARRDEIAALESELVSLQVDFDRLSRALDAAAVAADEQRIRAEEAERRLDLALNPPEIVPSEEQIAAERAAKRALEEARAGGDYQRIPAIGFTMDERLTRRLDLASSGLAVDSTGAVPVLYDPGLSYRDSAIYLTVDDPLGQPVLRLTVQYVSETSPLHAQTSFISIEGSDPLDPVDPIVFSSNPVRETDGRYLREAFSVPVDRSLLNRVSRMLSSGTFSSTFVGSAERETHVPGRSERNAMSRVLFAFLDLGGYR